MLDEKGQRERERERENGEWGELHEGPNVTIRVAEEINSARKALRIQTSYTSLLHVHPQESSPANALRTSKYRCSAASIGFCAFACFSKAWIGKGEDRKRLFATFEAVSCRVVKL